MRHIKLLGLLVIASWSYIEASIEFANNTAKFILANPTSQLTLPPTTQILSERSIVKKKQQVAIGSTVTLYETSSQDLLVSTSDVVAYNFGQFLTQTADTIYDVINHLPPPDPNLENRVIALEVGLTSTYNYLDDLWITDSALLNERITLTMNDCYDRIDDIDLSYLEPRVAALETGLASTYDYLYNLIDTDTIALGDRITATMNDVHLAIDPLAVQSANLAAGITASENHLTDTYNYLYTLLDTTTIYLDNRITETMNDFYDSLNASSLMEVQARIGLFETDLTNTYNFLNNLIITDVNALNTRITTTLNDLHVRIGNSPAGLIAARVDAFGRSISNMYSTFNARLNLDRVRIVRANDLSNEALAEIGSAAGKPLFRVLSGRIAEPLFGDIIIDGDSCFGFAIDSDRPLNLTLKDGAQLKQGGEALLVKPSDVLVIQGKGNRIILSDNMRVCGTLIFDYDAELTIEFSFKGTAVGASVFFAPDAKIILKGNPTLNVEGMGVVGAAPECTIVVADSPGELIEKELHGELEAV